MAVPQFENGDFSLPVVSTQGSLSPERTMVGWLTNSNAGSPRVCNLDGTNQCSWMANASTSDAGIWQVLTFPAAGRYKVTFKWGNPATFTTTGPVEVRVDGVAVWTVLNGSQTRQILYPAETAEFDLEAGDHAIGCFYPAGMESNTYRFGWDDPTIVAVSQEPILPVLLTLGSAGPFVL